MGWKNTIFCSRLRMPAVLLVFLLLAYLPLSSFHFALKNDAFLYNFPNKFFFSEALQNGILPTWNPYLNYGFPLYADPGFAWWQPISWAFGLIGYNAYTFTVEMLLYLYIAGLGMYCLIRKLKLSRITALCCAAMFMCSGFFIGNMQHINFITCAAFLPWFLGFWIQLQTKPTWKAALATAVAIFLLCTGGHPAIPIATLYYGLALVSSFAFFRYKEKWVPYISKFNLLGLGFALILLIPLIWSLYTLFPYYSRNTVIDQAGQDHLGFTIASYLSFINPLPTAKGPAFFQTDVSMRNAYCSLLAFLLLIPALLNKNKNGFQKTFLALLVAGIFLAAGGFIKQLIFGNLPLLGYIKSNGEYRVFIIIPILVLAAYELEKLTQQNANTIRWIQKSSLVVFVLSLLLVVVLGFQLINDPIISPPKTVSNVKVMLDQSRAIHFTFAASLILLFISFFLNRSAKKLKPISLILIVFSDLLIHTWAMLPITGVGMTSVKKMQQIISRSPVGFPHPETLNYNAGTVDEEEKRLIGDWGWYDKKLLKQTLLDYPSALKKQVGFDKIIQNNISLYSWNYINNRCSLTQFMPTAFTFDCMVSNQDTLQVSQHYFPGWHVRVNDINVQPLSSETGFLKIPMKKGTKSVVLYFDPFAR